VFDETVELIVRWAIPAGVVTSTDAWKVEPVLDRPEFEPPPARSCSRRCARHKPAPDPYLLAAARLAPCAHWWWRLDGRGSPARARRIRCGAGRQSGGSRQGGKIPAKGHA